MLADILSVLRSTLSFIYLAILYKADAVQKFGYTRVLEPLFNDLKSLEEDGLFVPCFGKNHKGCCIFCDYSVGGLLKVSVHHTFADVVLESGASFKNLNSGQEYSLVEQNSNTSWTLKQHWPVTTIAMK